MARKVLAGPEEDLAAVIAVLRAGLAALPSTPAHVRDALLHWCAEEDAYLQGEEDED